MNRLLFCFRAVRNNVRTAPLVLVALVWAIAIAFAFEAWALRMGYLVEIDNPDDAMFIVYISLMICGVLFLFLMFMYWYWLKITDERNVPYERMGAPRLLLIAEGFIEMLFMVAIGCVLGYVFDCILATVAPRSDYIKYLDACLFFKTCGVILIAPAAVFVIRNVFTAIVRARKRF